MNKEKKVNRKERANRAIAMAKYVRLSPRKARLVADLIRGKDALEAIDILEFTNKKAARLIKKTLESAIANGIHNCNMNEENLKVATIMINDGPALKRVMPRAMGRADIIRKPTAHIIVEVAEKN